MKRSTRLLSLLATILLVIPLGSSAEDEPPLTVNLKRLSLEAANQIAQGAIDACRKEGIQIGVTVVDRDGAVQSVMRDTIAAPVTISISRQKAFTAVNFNVSTSQLKERANTPIGRVDGLVMSSGGLPIQAGGQLLGGVGVSGAPDGKTDEMCAQAGIDRVIDDLEMGI
jgi:uncharacterized protein GlcG (DUF336 family)